MNIKTIHTDWMTIQFEYFGLSASATIQINRFNGSNSYRCVLPGSLNPIEIGMTCENNDRYWIDLKTRVTTPLVLILGQAIENHLG
ncbi:MAG: hypothetical protein ACXWB9_02365, partial [Flavisolibacter sp.]